MERQQYYSSPEDEVKGFAILDEYDDGKYLIGENVHEHQPDYLSNPVEAGWKRYVVSGDALSERVDSGASLVGTLSSEQYMRICEKLDVEQ